MPETPKARHTNHCAKPRLILMASSTRRIMVASTVPSRRTSRFWSTERIWLSWIADWNERPFPFVGSTVTSTGYGTWRALRGDRSYNSNRTVPIFNVVLNDDRWPGLLNLVSSRGIKLHEVDVASSRKRHLDLDLASFRCGLCLDFSNVCHASSSRGNHSVAIARSLSAFARYPALSCSRRLCRP